MNLLSDFEILAGYLFEVFMTDILFPPPIGYVSPFDISAFMCITAILAETIRNVASRRD